MILFATLFSTVIWVTITRLALCHRGRQTSPKVRAYLVASTIFVAMTTLLAIVLAVTSIE